MRLIIKFPGYDLIHENYYIEINFLMIYRK
jgi:hypothetical protein